MNNNVERENELFESMYAELEQIDAPRRQILLSEFVEFLPLYQCLPGKIPTPGSEEELEIRRLSTKFARRVNVHKPLALIDDVTGEVIVELPAHWSTTKLLTNNEKKRNENFHIESAHDFPGVADAAHQKLQAGFIISQALQSSALTEIRKAELIKELEVLKIVNPEKFNQIYLANKPTTTQEESVITETDCDLVFSMDE